MNRINYFFLVSVLFASHIWAAEGGIDINGSAENGAIYPVSAEVVSGIQDGTHFLSVTGDIFESSQTPAESTVENIDADAFEWSYARGVGTLPGSCPTGYSPGVALCAQDCPQGYRSVFGACWEDCPKGWTDLGLFCTNFAVFFPESQGKDVFAQHMVAKACESGFVNEAGLCYEPCAETFTGVGPLCFGKFDNASSVARVRRQVEEQHQQALTQVVGGGIVIADEQSPQLQTDIAFTPIICSLGALDGVFGLPIPDLASLADLATETTNETVSEAIAKALEGDTNSAWLVPSLSQTVLFDFSAEATCEDDGVVATAALNFNPSVTVKASTSMFDPVLHNLAGVDLGIVSLSVYELIPFRIYGTAGASVSADTNFLSVIDRSRPAAIVVEGRQFADNIALDILPRMDFWLSVDAYLRVTSFLSFIPDLLQLGAEFKLYVLELAVPYHLEEGVRENEVGYEAFKAERLETQLASGHGYIDVFLRILGMDTGAFEGADLNWEGYRENKVIIDSEEVELIDL